jgi:hypothetical protein
VTPAPTTFTRSVVNGFGSGTYPAGTSVDVFANPAGSGAAFNMWTGDTKYLVDANSYHTTLTAPAGSSLTVTANYTLGVPVVSPTRLGSAPINTPPPFLAEECGESYGLAPKTAFLETSARPGPANSNVPVT